MELLKKIGLIMLIIIIILIVFDYVPVKFAISIDNAQRELRSGSYICETNPVAIDTSIKTFSVIGWYIIPQINNNSKFSGCGARLLQKSPENILLQKTFDFKNYEHAYNRFLINGNIKKIEENKKSNFSVVDLNVSSWEIIYPIERASFRRFYVPDNYLTIYDYDWIKIIKSIFNW